MKKIKLVILFIAVFLASLLFINPVLAQESKHAVIVNPIRGNDFWEYNHGLLDTPQKTV